MSESFFARFSRYFFSLTFRPFLWMLENLLGLDTSPRRLEPTNRLKVYVKTSSQRTIPLELNLDWTVEDIKRQLRAILDIEEDDNLGIILAGRELADDVRVGHCDLSNMTILHAVQVVHKPAAKVPLNEELVDLQITGKDRNDEQAIKAHFFVYCKHEESNLQAGKLRVRCHSCKEGSILIERDPCGWQDVLAQPGKIRGHCLSGKCSTENLAPVQFYFKCNESGCAQDHEAPPLPQIRINLHDVPCLACAESMETVLVFECQDRHVICLECFATYVQSRLSDRQLVVDKTFGYTLGCPVNCENSLISEHKHLLATLTDRNDYERYQRFAAEECILQAGGVLCPQPRCGTGIIPDNPEERKVKCQQCQFVFCKDCHQGYHIGSCEASVSEPLARQMSTTSSTFDPETLARARWQDQKVDNSSLIAIKVMTKPCPKCRTPTERDGGCMHMVKLLNCNLYCCIDLKLLTGMYEVPISVVLDLSN